MTQKIRVGILGASGYTGADLIRLLLPRDDVEIVLLTANQQAGRAIAEVWPHLAGYALPDLIHLDEVEWPAIEVDVIFCALPHATSQPIIKGLMHAVGHSLAEELVAEGPSDFANQIRSDVKIIDLSADFRLRDPDAYEYWYGQRHQAQALQSDAVYGLTELNRQAVKSANLVACPGCYPTAALLALQPLVAADMIDSGDIAIDAKSGVTGAGRSAKQHLLLAEAGEGLSPYGVSHHRHMAEIDQELSASADRPVMVSFTPHLIPMSRGELETIYVKLSGTHTAEDLRDRLQTLYAEEPFVTLLPPGQIPSTQMVRGSNRAVLNVFADRRPGQAIIIVAIDNLVKGSSGQAIQNMNAMFGLPETLGLDQVALFP